MICSYYIASFHSFGWLVTFHCDYTDIYSFVFLLKGIVFPYGDDIVNSDAFNILIHIF